jgi:hypothetical protein
MPLLVALAGVLFVLLLAIVLTPLSIVLRYRAGTLRRIARGWQVTATLVLTSLSAVLLLTVAAVSTLWLPSALQFALAGFLIGGLLGGLGLAFTRWETTPTGLAYTPNRWLVLLITLIVALRVLYGFWRSWHAWQAAPDGSAWVAASGAAGVFGAAATVLGYYLVFWIGVRRRIGRRRRSGASLV